MKNIGLILMIALMLPQLVFANGVKDLKSLVDDYTYSMTVEWDQKDQEFAKTRESEFQLAIKELVKNGLTRKDLETVFSADKVREMETEMSQLDLTRADAVTTFLAQKRSVVYQRGANWTGDVVDAALIGGLAIIIVYAILVAPELRYSRCIGSGKSDYECRQIGG